MGVKTEELKATAQLRKAILPLVDLMRKEADAELEKRLETIEAGVEAILKRDMSVEVKAPEITVNVPTKDLERIISKHMGDMVEKSANPSSPTYEPHDQVKKGTFQYSGFVNAEGDWYIQRVAKGEQRYAKGNGNYAKAWEDVGNQKYGYIDG